MDIYADWFKQPGDLQYLNCLIILWLFRLRQALDDRILERESRPMKCHELCSRPFGIVMTGQDVFSVCLPNWQGWPQSFGVFLRA